MNNAPHQTHTVRGYLAAVGATAIWSGNFIIARGLSGSIPPVSLAFWRWSVAVLVFLPFAIKAFLRDLPIIRKHPVYFSVTALLGVTLFNTLVYTAGQTSTAVNLSMISITSPVFIIILARLFMGEAITVNKRSGIILVVFGVLLLLTRGNLSRLTDLTFAIGDLWMLLAALTFAVYSILLKHKPEGIGLWSFQFGTFLAGLLFLTPFYLWERAVVPSFSFTTPMILSILYVGMFASLCAFLLWNQAVISIGPAKAGMIYYSVPIFSAFLAVLILGEQLRWYHPISLLIIVTGILIANKDPR